MGRNARLRKLRRKERHEFQAHPEMAAWVKRAEKNQGGPGVVYNSCAEKMSEVIQEFAEPLLTGAESMEEAERAMVFAMSVMELLAIG